MSIAACLWCETTLKLGTVTCPECGLQSPTDDPKAMARSRAGAVVRRGRRVVLALVVVPLMLSAAYAARTGALPIVSSDTVSNGASPLPSLVEPPAAYSDPLERSVWVDGVKAVQQALALPGYDKFDTSYVSVAAGHVVSFCGEVAGTSGYDSDSGAQRFISVFGQAQATMLEGNDASFEVLWNRVCARGDSAA